MIKTTLTLLGWKMLTKIIILLICLTFSFFDLKAQGGALCEEGFEGAHGWTLSNGSSTNKWHVGTATHNGGLRSLYITPPSNTNNDYSNSSTVVHAYKDIFIPAGSTTANFSFDWKCRGERTGLALYTYRDYFRVWLVPTTFTLTVGAQITPATGRIQVGGYFWNQTNFVSHNSIINVSSFAGGNMRLVFEWINDNNNTQNNPPAAIDNIYISRYCIPSTSTVASNTYISNISFLGTLNDVSNPSTYSTSSPGYQNFTRLTKAIQAQGEGINIQFTSNVTSQFKAWVDWNGNGVFNPGEEVYNTGNTGTPSGTFGFVIPLATPPGDYRIRLRNYRYESFLTALISSGYSWGDNYTDCEPFNDARLLGIGTVKYGEAEDYLFTVIPRCAIKITAVTDGEACTNSSASVTIGATATGGSPTGYRWYANEFGGSALATTTLGTWSTPVISTTTTYWVTAYNGTCESTHRTPVVAKINPIPTIGFDVSNNTICGENFDNVIITAAADKEAHHLINEKFETNLGVFTSANIGSGSTQSVWTRRQGVYIPDGQVWFPAISSGGSGNWFVMANFDHGDYSYDTTLTSSSVNTNNFLNLTLKFKSYYSYFGSTGEVFRVEVSENAGPWTSVYIRTSNLGIGTRFENVAIPLDGYTDVSNLRIRFRFTSGWADGIAIDNVELYGERPLNTLFTWTGGAGAIFDSDCLTNYSGASSSVCIKPISSQIENDENWTITATAELSNGCNASGNVILENKTKVWNTTLTTDWNTANWKPSNTIPTLDNCIIIKTPLSIQGTSNGYAKNLLVTNAGSLTVNSGNNLYVKDGIANQGINNFIVKNNANLIQIDDDAINVGEVDVERISRDMNYYGYTYWGSPVATTYGAVKWYPETAVDSENFSTTPANNVTNIYAWNPSDNPNPGNHQVGWIYLNFASSIPPGSGFIAKAPNDFGTTEALRRKVKTIFTGTPHNSTTLTRTVVANNGSDPVNNPKLSFLSNPYPSAININKFLFEYGQGLSATTPYVVPTIYLWTHASTPVVTNGNYSYSDTDFATYTLIGGTETSPVINEESPLVQKPNGLVASGQGFFIKGVATSHDVRFKNSYRYEGTASVPTSYNNSHFFRMMESNISEASEESTEVEFESHRFWLNFTNTEAKFKQILLGYSNIASDGLDALDGAYMSGGNSINLYSLLDSGIYTIQTFAMPFNDTDVIPLGYKVGVSGTYRIALDDFDGLFVSQDIYLKDKTLGTEHNLKDELYEFVTNSGTFEERFEIVFRTETMGVENPNLDHKWIVYSDEDKFHLESIGFDMKDVYVYDMLGREVYSKQNVNSTSYTIDKINANQVLIVKMISIENKSSFKKIQN